MLAQLLRQNGGCQVTIAAPKGLKMDLAKDLDAADTYIELSRDNPEAQFEQLKKDNPYGFDIGKFSISDSVFEHNFEVVLAFHTNNATVVEATGSVKILEDAINYVRRGGTLVVYG